MKNLLLTILLSLLLSGPVASQSLKLNLFGGGGTSNIPYGFSDLYHSFVVANVTGQYSIQGYYMWGGNISYPIYKNEFGLYIETNNRFTNVEPISYRSNLLTAGLNWYKPFSVLAVELSAGYGFSWDEYEIEKSAYEKYNITNRMTVFQGGFNIYFPITDIIQLTVGGRIIFNNQSHVSVTSYYVDKSDIEVPSTTYGGIVGISIDILKIGG
ncbi:MAG: hypothetical protein K9J16_00225 [Melioribacteraceae bacterium]|nr:hypothetical protein [Melioribacteraceae bacterium]MCF8353935.1 hypothetical protein [Melioribacteraceae bacterium]MCF8392692.1 hypothetical protein [Melioribacteraceae bacterium]MCF8417714.1 hypothetical protein [Melioribacteraceae bacterium]